MRFFSPILCLLLAPLRSDACTFSGVNVVEARFPPATDTEHSSAEAANDRVTSYSWKALAGSAIGYAMDGFDLLILGFMLTTISSSSDSIRLSSNFLRAVASGI